MGSRPGVHFECVADGAVRACDCPNGCFAPTRFVHQTSRYRRCSQCKPASLAPSPSTMLLFYAWYSNPWTK